MDVDGHVARGTFTIILALFLTACGLGPTPDTPPPASTGNAPWRDLGVAHVCLGEQAFAPPDTLPGGLCVRESFFGTACTADSECRSRETCECGRCTVSYCAVSSDCEAPRFCNFSQHRCDLACEGDGDCTSDELCLGGVCRSRCIDSTACQQGEVCEGNICIGDDCSTTADCLAGERCDVQRIPQQVLEPAPVATGAEITLYLDLAAPATPDLRAIWRAVSRDGIHFTIDPPAPVLDGRAPSALVDAGVTYVYHEHAGELRVATSRDGVTFDPPITLLAGPDLHAPSAVHVDGTVALYFARGGSIGLATGPRDTGLTDLGTILSPTDAQVGDGTPGTAFWIPVTELASPHAIVAGPDEARSIDLWFSGFGRESPEAIKFGSPTEIPPNFSVGFAAAAPTDPGSFAIWPYGPVADRVEVFLEHHDELGPAAVALGPNRFRLYYVEATHETTPTFTLGRLSILGSGR